MVKKKQPAKKEAVRLAAGTDGSARAEEALTLSEGRYRTILDNMQDSYIEVDLAGNFTFINEATCRNLGYTMEELTGQNFSIISPGKDESQAIFTAFNEVYKTGEPNKGFAFKVVRKDGTTGYAETSISILKNEQGRIIGFRGVGRDVTERKQSEAALTESEAKYRRIVETAIEGIIVIDSLARITFVNQQMASMLGYEVEELLGRKFESYMAEEELDDHYTQMSLREQGKSAVYERCLRRKDGGILWALISAKAIYDSEGRREGSFGMLTDITERKQAEARAKIRRELAFKLAGRVDLEPALKHCLDAAIEISGFDTGVIYIFDEKSGDFKAACYHGGSAFLLDHYSVLKADSVDAHVIKKGLPLYLKAEEFSPPFDEQLRPEGFTFDATIPVLHQNKVIASLGIFSHTQDNMPDIIRNSLETIATDIGVIIDRKLMEKLLIDNEARYRSLFENNPAAVYSVDMQGRFTSVNAAAMRLTGYSEEEALRISIANVVAPDYLDIMRSHFIDSLRGKSQSYEVAINAKDGKRIYVYITGTPIIIDGNIVGVYGIAEDISIRKRLEEEQQRVEKLESVGLLAGGIAHDFNNILTAILGNISLASMEAAPGSEIQKSLEQAEKASLRAKDLTKQLLTFSRGGAPVTKLASLTDLLRDTAGFALRGSNVKCHFSIPDDLWHAEIDAGQVSQVMHNLVINAQQAMPTGGTIELTTENITLSETQRLGRGLPLKAGDYIRIAVTDQGTGIRRDHLEKIFDPFFSTKQQGSGLGLATSFSIARRHGGHISVESEPGFGSTFYFYLPASRETVTPKHGKKEPAIAVGKARILVMDDEQGVREVAGRMLKHIGYKDIEFASDGVAAVKLYKAAMKSGNPFNVVILDLTIPGGMGGKETIRKLLKIDPGVKAIVSSGYTDDSVMAEYRGYGFRGMAAKPYTLEQLGKALRDVIAQKRTTVSE